MATPGFDPDPTQPEIKIELLKKNNPKSKSNSSLQLEEVKNDSQLLLVEELNLADRRRHSPPPVSGSPAAMAEMSSNQNYDPSKDPKRKAKSNDPGWKYGFWPDLTNKDLVECSLCHKRMHSGIKRLKQHLLGGYGDVGKCSNTSTKIMREIQQYLQQKQIRYKAYKNNSEFDIDGDDAQEDSMQQRQSSSHYSAFHPSSGTSAKRKQSTLKFAELQSRTGKQSKLVASIFRRTPEEVIEERPSKDCTQRTLESYSRTKEDKERIHMHIAKFFYACGIPLNVASSRSFKVMVESIGQVGPGVKPPSYHELSGPLFEKVVKETDILKEKHMIAWKQYGCTLMSDGWTDQKNRHFINFLVNSPKGTFFLGSVDASRHSHDATMLADLLEEKIVEIGKDNVVQVVTNNGVNYKAAGRLLEQRIPTLFWTPCAAHCLHLMLEDIGELQEIKTGIESARCVTTFIYMHERILNATREMTGGRELVRPGATRFATTFLTLQSLYKRKNALRRLFVKEWYSFEFTITEGERVRDIVLSSKFWDAVEDCIRASHPLLIVLRLVDGDAKPAMPELSMAMDGAKKKINESFANKSGLVTKLIDIIERRWTDQIEVKLYGAALFLNPSKYFELKANDNAYARRQRSMFNDVLEKMVTDDDLQAKISDQVDDYDNMRGSFGKQMTIRQQKTKNLLDWWNAFGCLHIQLQSLAFRIVGLCCSFGCERNLNTFEFIHTKRRNRLEHKRLNDLVYIQYNEKITTRIQKWHEEGSNFNPLILEEFQWDNEWVANSDDVDDDNLESSNLPKRCHVGEASGPLLLTYSRRRKCTSTSRLIDDDVENEELEPFPNDDEDVTDEELEPFPNDDEDVTDEELEPFPNDDEDVTDDDTSNHETNVDEGPILDMFDDI